MKAFSRCEKAAIVEADEFLNKISLKRLLMDLFASFCKNIRIRTRTRT